MEADFLQLHPVDVGSPHELPQAQQGRYGLGNHRGQGGACHPQGEHRHQQQVQEDVQTAAEAQKIHRGFGVSQPPQRGSQHIILKGEQKAHQVNTQIGFCLNHGGCRGLNPAQQVSCQGKPQGKHA